MRMNASMRQLLDKANVELSRALDQASPEHLRAMVTVGNSVLFADQYEGCRHFSIEDFQDRTGYESFVNHYHLRWGGSPAEVRDLIAEVAGIRRSLAGYAPGKNFLIIMSIAKEECTIRFHECRPAESWLDDDLEGYTEEAVAAIGVGNAADC
jgi:hypothetical protein